jgi:D-alanyl-D-alanine carboxypeptidase
MSSLRELQSRHVLYTGKLIDWATQNGYELTWGETLRTPAQAMINAANGSGITHSLHLIKLAVDLSLFKDGVLLESVDDYRPLGEYWKSLDPLCCWGGDFATRPDADHFSITWQGVR